MRDRDNVSTAKRSTGQDAKGRPEAGTGSKRRESQPSKRQRAGPTARERFSITTVMGSHLPLGTGQGGVRDYSPSRLPTRKDLSGILVRQERVK